MFAVSRYDLGVSGGDTRLFVALEFPSSAPPGQILSSGGWCCMYVYVSRCTDTHHRARARKRSHARAHFYIGCLCPSNPS